MRNGLVALGVIAALGLLAWLWLGWDMKGGASAGPVATRAVATLPDQRADLSALESNEVRERAQVSADSGGEKEPSEPEEATSESALVNRLNVAVVGPDGEPWAFEEVRLRAPRSVFATPPRFEGSLPAGVSFRVSGGADERGEYTLLLTDGRGRVEASGLVPGLAFELAVVDSLGGVGVQRDCAGMGPQEQRQVLLTIARAPRSLRARCVDEAGTPLEGATVIMQAGDDGRVARTDPDGFIESTRLFVDELEVSASLDSCVSARLEHVDPSDGAVTLTLRKGRTLRVDLRDTLGRAVQIGSLIARLPGTEQTWVSYLSRKGHLEIKGLPLEPLTLEYCLDGVRVRMDVDAHSEAVGFEVAPLGLLEVQVGKLSAEPDENFLLEMRCLDDPTREPHSHTVFSTGNSFVSRPLWPGRHELQLNSWRTTPDGVIGVVRPYGSPLVVEIQAGVTTSAHMGS